MHEPVWVCGVASPPLKDESALSVMLRIASSNALTHKQTLELLLDRRVSSHEQDLLSIGLANGAGWGRRIGWQWQPAEAELMPALPGLNRVIWSRQTKWCPVCTGLGFHSVWFQLSALAACPIHGCPLITQCAACGVPTGLYKLSRALFKKPYYCPSCSRPIAQSERSVAERWAFLRQAEEVERAFAPLARWYVRATRELIFLDASCRRFQNNEVPRFKAGLLDGAIRELVPFPREYALSRGRKVQIRSYKIRLARDVPRGGPPSRYGLLTAGTVLSVYQSTTRSLLRLVMQQSSKTQFYNCLEFHNGDIASVEGWRSERLALVLMRCFFEAPYFLASPSPIGGAVLRSSIFAPAVIANCLIRANCRSVVLATFLAAYEMANDFVDRGFILRQDLHAAPDELIVLVGAVSAGALDALVAFPETTVSHVVARGSADAAALVASVKSLNAAFYESDRL
uniref:TniQ family protein n=1 Tax=Burkholderia sp. (strain CCGE1003) TaxID=640512 RepID=E1TI46_BURSG